MSEVNKISALNIALSNALGITSTERLTRVELVLLPGEMPEVTATYMLPGPDGLVAAIATFELRPQAQIEQKAA